MARRVVVIGSGPGGLSAAVFLSRFGFDVTVLEQAKQLGGFINPFVRSRYEFDPGLHYMGDCDPDRPTGAYFEELGIDPAEVFCELDPGGFDHYQFPGLRVAMCKGLEQYQARLTELFPLECDGLAHFFRAVRAFRDFSDVMTRVFPRRSLSLGDIWQASSFLRLVPFARATYGELLRSYLKDPQLMAVLAGNCGDYGLPPGKVSALYALSIFAHFTQGAYFPRGGGRALRDRLIRLAIDSGAHFLRRQRVTRLTLRGGKVVGVETEDGGQFAADVVVSAIDPAVTFGQLIGEAHLPGGERRSLRQYEPSAATFCLYLGVKRDLSRHGLGAFNLWHYPSWDIDATFAPLLRGELWKEPPLFFSANSLKDDTGALAPAGSSTLDVMTFAPFSHFAPGENERPYKRSLDYTEKKRQYTDFLLGYIDRILPGMVGDVVVCEASTPATNSYYVASLQGGIYGPAATPNQSVLFRHGLRTFIPNLFLAGGGTLFGSGVAPALYSGRLAARLVAEMK